MESFYQQTSLPRVIDPATEFSRGGEMSCSTRYNTHLTIHYEPGHLLFMTLRRALNSLHRFTQSFRSRSTHVYLIIIRNHPGYRLLGLTSTPPLPREVDQDRDVIDFSAGDKLSRGGIWHAILASTFLSHLALLILYSHHGCDDHDDDDIYPRTPLSPFIGHCCISRPGACHAYASFPDSRD